MKYVKSFFKRGMMAAWGGPVILAAAYLILDDVGVLNTLTVPRIATAIITMTIMAFIAGGISIVYDAEQLPPAVATIIQMAVLYIDCLLFCRLNSLVPNEGLVTFTVIFAAAFIVIWLIVYFGSIRPGVKKLNEKLNASN